MAPVKLYEASKRKPFKNIVNEDDFSHVYRLYRINIYWIWSVKFSFKYTSIFVLQLL